MNKKTVDLDATHVELLEDGAWHVSVLDVPGNRVARGKLRAVCGRPVTPSPARALKVGPVTCAACRAKVRAAGNKIES
jgi:hypothetical protein